jgi:hypothetical protein
MGPVTTKFAKVDPGPSQTFGWLGFGISGVGIVLVLVSFTAVIWERDGHFKFADLRHLVDRLETSPLTHVYPVAKAYFTWLAWVLLIVAAVCAVLAATPAISAPFRVITPLVAVAGIALTFIAIDIFAGPGYSTWIKSARPGFYLAVIGFLLVGVGSALGTNREHRPALR